MVFSLQILGCNGYLFQKKLTDIYNDVKRISDKVSLYDELNKCRNMNILSKSYYIKKIKCKWILLFSFFFIVQYFVGTIFEIKLNAQVKKYTVTLTLNITDTIYPQGRILPLHSLNSKSCYFFSLKYHY